MKLRYFSLFMVVLIVFSLGTVVASENVAFESSCLNDTLAIDDNCDSNGYSDDRLSGSQGFWRHDSSNDVSDNATDLSVKIDVENVYVGNKFNREGYEIPWTITAKVTGEIAQNTNVYHTFSDNMEYVSHNTTIGEYNPITGIWDIGDLSSSDNASLTILTKLKSDGEFTVTANATTDSADKKLSNNFKSLYTKSGSSQESSNVTETSDDKGGANHDSHQGSQSSIMDVDRVEKPSTDISNTDSGVPETKSREDKVSEPGSDSSPASSSSSDSGSGSSFGLDLGSVSSSSLDLGSVSKNVLIGDTLNTVTNQISNSIESVGDSIMSIFNPGSSSDDDSDSNASSASVSKAVAAQDYTKIPILIFILFLIISLPVIAYDKIKS